MLSPSPKAKSLAPFFLHKPNSPTSTSGIEAQLQHRIDLVQYWDIKPGSRVLEIGCGQGDTTLVLADAVGEEGHVDAIDPGAPDYGSPYTLSQSQAHILSSPLGARITFHRTTLASFLHSQSAESPPPSSTKPYDYAILSHSIFYFATPSILPSILTALLPYTRTLCVAEWALCASIPAAQPHVLAVLLLGALEAKRAREGGGNVRCVVSPKGVVECVGAGEKGGKGWGLVREVTRESGKGLRDGVWEVGGALENRNRVMEELVEDGVSGSELAALRAMYDAVEAGVGLVDGGVEGVRSMDVWAAVLRAL